MTLWQLILNLSDGFMYVYKGEVKTFNLKELFYINQISDFSEVKNGKNIVDSFERKKGIDGLYYYIVVVSDEVDEDENGCSPVFE